MFSFIKRLFCKHEYKVWYNIYGDEIIWCGFNRSVWECSKCEKITYRAELVEGAPMRPDIELMLKQVKDARFE
jgi:hypothetical protein